MSIKFKFFFSNKGEKIFKDKDKRNKGNSEDRGLLLNENNWRK